MVGVVTSAAVLGVDGYPLRVEVDVSNGLPTFEIVGLPDVAVREARERVRAAIRNSGYDFPNRRITVNLAPARLRKEGPAYDLPIALAVLVAAGSVAEQLCADAAYLGELSLDGGLRPVAGVLPAAGALVRAGCRRLIVPRENAAEAGLVAGLTVCTAATLVDVITGLASGEWGGVTAAVATPACAGGPDLATIHGQPVGKRAVEIAAAGGHHLLFTGPPGTGKSLLAHALAGILPPLSDGEALAVSTIASVAGLLRDGALIRRRPFRAPHHTTSPAALVGGGRVPVPGEVSLAHGGVLFLDELPEFRRDALEALREPLENGALTVLRGGISATFPARFSLVASMNPCPCGKLGDADAICTCTPGQIQRYQSRLSGPLLDRIDMVVHVGRMTYDALNGGAPEETSKTVARRVDTCRQLQERRYGGAWLTNAGIPAAAVRQFCTPDEAGAELLAAAFERFRLSNRAHDRVLRVARTVADLAGSRVVRASHVAEAVQFCGAAVLG